MGQSMKEKMDKKMVLVVQESLHKDFAHTCESQYKTVSEVIRDFMLQYIKEHKSAENMPKVSKRN